MDDAHLVQVNGLARAIDRLNYGRRLIPLSRVPAMVERRVDRLWENDDFRLAQEKQMRYLLEFTERADEVPDLARKFTEHHLLRQFLIWHPREVLLPVRDIEWLTTERDPGRAVIVNFMHHHLYDGLFTSITDAGAPMHVLTSPKVLSANTALQIKQHIRLVGRRCTIIPAVGGTAAIQEQVIPGRTIAIASDVPGHTEVTFLGRRVLASLGAALISTRTNSPVVIATYRRDGDERYIQLHEPLEPKDFDEPMDLLREIVRQHGEAVLAWPEAVEMPRARWGILEE